MKRPTIPQRVFELKKMAAEAQIEMLTKIDTENDMEYGYVISRILLSLSHNICKLLPYEQEETE